MFSNALDRKVKEPLSFLTTGPYLLQSTFFLIGKTIPDFNLTLSLALDFF